MVRAVKTRQCAGCGEYRDAREMFRIVRTPEKEIVFDPSGRMNGRGVYLCRNNSCIEKAFSRKGIARSLHLNLQPQTESDLKQLISKEMDGIEK